MRIIRQGRDHPEWKKQVVCGPSRVGAMVLGSKGCGALLEIDWSDLFFHEMEADKATLDLACFQCPICHAIVSADEPPEGLPRYEAWKARAKPPYR